MNSPQDNRRQARRGFTLIEIIVSLAIFAIVCVVALSALVKIIDANKRAQSVQDAVTNTSFALDAMSRELRSGSAYYCDSLGPSGSAPATLAGYLSNPAAYIAPGCLGPADYLNGGNGAMIAFQSTKLDPSDSTCRLVYAYEISGSAGSWAFQKAEQSACGGSLSFASIIDPSTTDITSYFVEISQQTGGDFPLAFMNLSGYAGSKAAVRTYFTVQTAASPRVP